MTAVVVWLALAWVAGAALAYALGFSVGRARKIAGVVVSIPQERAIRCLECGAFSVGPENRNDPLPECKRCGGPQCRVRASVGPKLDLLVDVDVDEAISVLEDLRDRLAMCWQRIQRPAPVRDPNAPRVEISSVVSPEEIEKSPEYRAILETAAERRQA